eukprot:COSAG02_NODE_187_length_30377_cov_3.636271_38_plen_22_part_01
MSCSHLLRISTHRALSLSFPLI